MTFTNERYRILRDIFKGQRLPLAFVDLDAFDSNIAYAAEKARSAGKRIRLGTKSIRCEPLMEWIMAHSDVYRGFLTYTVEETKFLADKGHDDFIVAYPTVQPSDLGLLTRLVRDGKSVSVMVDCLEHLTILSATGEQTGVPLSACLEVDLSYRPLGTDRVHLGLRRSPIRTSEQALELAHPPLLLPSGSPEILLDDPVFFQHAKAGELCERFNELYLLKDGKIVDLVKTYRGEGMNFL